MTDCRIEFALLTTVCSLPVAFHPASRRRSYLQLSGAGLTQVRTFTQLFVCTCRRTRSCRPRRVPRSVQITITFRFGKPTVPNTLPPMRARMKGLSGSYTTGVPLRGNIEQECHKERIGTIRSTSDGATPFGPTLPRSRQSVASASETRDRSW